MEGIYRERNFILHPQGSQIYIKDGLDLDTLPDSYSIDIPMFMDYVKQYCNVPNPTMKHLKTYMRTFKELRENGKITEYIHNRIVDIFCFILWHILRNFSHLSGFYHQLVLFDKHLHKKSTDRYFNEKICSIVSELKLYLPNAVRKDLVMNTIVRLNRMNYTNARLSQDIIYLKISIKGYGTCAREMRNMIRDFVSICIVFGGIFNPYYIQFITNWIDTFDNMNLAWKTKIATNIQTFRTRVLKIEV